MIEIFQFDPDPQKRLRERKLARTSARPPFVLLETCDRIELYQGEGSASRQVLTHCAAVAAGLDSPLPGEKAVQGQVKAAYLSATEAGTVSSGLHSLFQNALGIAKKVRSTSGIDRGAITHAGAALTLLKERGLLETTKGDGRNGILLVGVNELSESILRTLAAKGLPGLLLANRNQQRAQSVAEQFGIQWAPLDDLPSKISACRVLISCSSAPHYLVHPSDLAGRGGREILLLDLAAPPDIDPEVALLAGVELIGLKDLEALMQGHLVQRRALLPEAWNVLEHELELRINRLEKKRLEMLAV